MTKRKLDPSTIASFTTIQDTTLVWDAPTFSDMEPRSMGSRSGVVFRLFHVTEISEGKAGAYRLSMANVLAGISDPRCNAIYVLSGTPEGVSLYIGISSTAIPKDDLHEIAQTLKASFEGNFLGAKLDSISEGNAAVEEMLQSAKHLGLVTGVPSFNEDAKDAGDEDFQGIERLANSLIGETWQLVVVAEPGTDADIQNTLDGIYDFSTELSTRQKQSVQLSENTGWNKSDTSGTSDSKTIGTNTSDTRGKNETANEGTGKNAGTSSGSSLTRSEGTSSNQGKSIGTNESHTKGKNESSTDSTNNSRTKGASGGESRSYTSERIDKRIEEIQKHLSENLLDRFQQGRSKGMFRTAMYISAKEAAIYERLASSVLSIFQGNESTMTPLRVEKLPTRSQVLPLQIGQYTGNSLGSGRALVYSVPFNESTGEVAGATWLNTRELSLVAGLPSKELPGLKIRKSVDFALNTGNTVASDKVLHLGQIMQHGRALPHKQVAITLADLTKHVFITGVTGAGKTTTCMKLLMESKLPFMVIEPAKTEYRALHALDDSIEYYILGREDLMPFRLNPFELVSPKENLAGHIDTIKATLNAVFPMEASMPYMVEEAIIKAYQAKGWDIHSGDNWLIDDPWVPGSDAWPIFSDMIEELGDVIKSKGLGKEFEDKYLGSLVSRLSNLTLGIKGRMLNTRHSLDFDHLLDKRVVIELEELKDEQDKALFMGFIITRLAECMKHRHRRNSNFRHLTLIEEAHRLLSRPEPGETGSRKMGVEMFANLLAEVRKYGEGLIIADQIPNKLVSDVIKNTHTKIVHRLFSADDRNTIGDAMGLSDEQKEFLPLLQTGETVIYCGGWHAPVWVRIDEQTKTDRPDIAEEEMAEKGIQQLWEQRHRLFPRLSARPEITDGVMLASFSGEGIKLINMFLAINRSTNAGVAKKEFCEKMQIRYRRNYDGCASHMAITNQTLAELLTELFFDCSGYKATEKTMLLAKENLKTVLPALHTSLDDFNVKRGNTKGKFCTMDNQLKRIESI